MSNNKEGCVSAAAGVEKNKTESAAVQTSNLSEKENVMTARVGQKAPGFEASALVNGTFKNVNLSEYLGKWVVLCFYPGDFTFV